MKEAGLSRPINKYSKGLQHGNLHQLLVMMSRMTCFIPWDHMETGISKGKNEESTWKKSGQVVKEGRNQNKTGQSRVEQTGRVDFCM